MRFHAGRRIVESGMPLLRDSALINFIFDKIHAKLYNSRYKIAKKFMRFAILVIWFFHIKICEVFWR